jgi:hypothetical protein
MKILKFISFMTILALSACSHAQKIKGYAFATEQVQGTIMADEDGRQMPPVRSVLRSIYLFIPAVSDSNLVVDSIFYADRPVDFSKGEISSLKPDFYVRGGSKWQPEKKEKGSWLSFYIAYAEHPDLDKDQFKLPVKVTGNVNSKSFAVMIKQEIWLEGMPAQ